MTEEQVTIEGLRWWSQFLLWVSVILPLLGGIAAGARYYVERYEKQLSSRLTATAIQNAKDEALNAKNDLARFKEQSAPRKVSDSQKSILLKSLAPLRGQAIAFACKLMDGESCAYANSLAAVFREAGCAVPDVVQTSLNDLPGYVAITAYGTVPSALLAKVADALSPANIDAKIESIKENSVGNWYQNIPHIIVGRKSP
jgi:mannitol-specific phosphotransferase system IIBC component